MLIPDIVERAHAAGLRVSAHIESAADFRLAVEAGVDIVAHLPGYDVAMDDDIARYRLSSSDAEMAKTKDVVVLTTTLLSSDRAEDEPGRLGRMMQNHAENLRLLHAAGVRLGVGSDQFSKNSIDELMNLASLEVFDNSTLLDLISSETPRAIFPNRKIGSLADGAEANFLVLGGNPLDAIENIRFIQTQVKDGVLLPSK
jgi:imidazolonepropionase-like amidohydrolase